MLGRIVHVVVDAQHDGDVLIRRRRGDDDLLHSATQMLRRFLGIGKSTGRLNHDLSANRIPIDFGRIFSRENLDSLSADYDRIAFYLHAFMKRAKDGVILQQMRQRLRVRKIVGCYKVNIRTVQACTDDIASDAPEPVDSYFYGHTTSV